MSFLYKELDEKEKEKINLEAKSIMDSFGKKLSSLKNLPEEGSIEREESFREETLDYPCDENLKQNILNNAKLKNKDFIIAEKKKW